ncbi:putative pentatricopeptide repeat-containing protein At1g64310 [Humulus lupulus]|uniref:putative pentatricopeptide repeat-containing protein At1g64310 n=1 Tax=Humulus lupulus TaxID=3486 RepID=UPI002B416752|nr:putative pentatricopeptide repeat-containing protein At1g64310 [Humulus lupulus]
MCSEFIYVYVFMSSADIGFIAWGVSVAKLLKLWFSPKLKTLFHLPADPALTTYKTSHQIHRVMASSVAGERTSFSTKYVSVNDPVVSVDWLRANIKDPNLEVGPITFETKFQPHLVWTLDQVQSNIENKTHQLIDAQSKPRFDGAVAEPLKGISGHVPGSKCVPFAQVLDASQSLLPAADELKKWFDQEATKKLHALIVKTQLSCDPFYATQMVRLYAIHGDLCSARYVFEKSPNRSVYLWNSIIRAHAQAHRFSETFSLLRSMLTTDIEPDGFTYACVVRSCSERFDMYGVKLIHAVAVVSGLGFDSICSSALVTAYSKLKFVDEASKVFYRIPEPDLVLWNTMISAYGNCGLWYKGLELFHKMQIMGRQPDGYTFVGLLLSLADSSIGQGIHGFCLKHSFDSNVHVGSALVSMYSRCKSMDFAYKVFSGILQPDLVTWSALISGYSQSGQHENAHIYFKKFTLSGKKADSILTASVLAATAEMVDVNRGSEIHAYALKQGLDTDVMVCCALIDMYSKCGFLGLGIQVFEIMPERNIVSYNALMLGYGLHGLASQAFRKFQEILDNGLIPDECTFSALLCSCCHAGLVEDGKHFFRIMKDKFCIQARAEHYVYMVRLLGMNGELEEAYYLIQSLPEPVDHGIWGALLSCCDACGNSRLAEIIGQQLIENNSESRSYKVMLSNIYAGNGRWDDARELRDYKSESQMSKMPGLSWFAGY